MTEEQKQVTVFITKYWQTKGIVKTKAVIKSNMDGMVIGGNPCHAVVGDGLDARSFYGTDYFMSLSEAVQHCCKKREAKIRSLKKSLDKVSKLDIAGRIKDGL